MPCAANISVRAPKKAMGTGSGVLAMFMASAIPLGETGATAFLDHLARDRHVAAATQNQALSTLLFLYREVMGQPLA